MSDRERNALEHAIAANSDEPYRSRAHPAIVREQHADGTVSVDLEDGGPTAHLSNLPLVYGVPGIRCEVVAGAQCRIAFDNGDPRKRVACGFGAQSATAALDVTSINIAKANANQGAARNGDSCGVGMLSVVPNPPLPGPIPNGGIIFYTPQPTESMPNPTSIPWLSIIGPVQITQLTPGPLPIGGNITGGSTIVKIGG